MKHATIVAILAAAWSIPSPALAQTGVKYKLEEGTELAQIFCLPPCACPFHQILAPTTGTFTLTLVDENPLFRSYAVTLADWLAVAPQGTMTVRGSGTYKIGGEVAITHQMVLDLLINGEASMRYDSGLVGADPLHRFPQIGIRIQTEQFGCRMNELVLVAKPVRCPADCDGSDSLTVNDFLCFLNNYAAADPYANCDGSSVMPTLNIADFVCFLNQFAAGCR